LKCIHELTKSIGPNWDASSVTRFSTIFNSVVMIPMTNLAGLGVCGTLIFLELLVMGYSLLAIRSPWHHRCRVNNKTSDNTITINE
jgi:hypothetical protein